jgi:PhnB protein
MTVMEQVAKDHVVKDQADILALVERVQKAHYDKDAAGIAGAYTADATLFSLAPPLARRGADMLREMEQWVATWDGPIERESRDLEIKVSGDSAFCHGYYRLGGTPKMAGKPISFWMRATVGLERVDGEWKIVHEHTSVPFYMDGSLRPAFDLVPFGA